MYHVIKMSSKATSKRKSKAVVPQAKRSAAVKLVSPAGADSSEVAGTVGTDDAVSDQEDEVTPYKSLLATISKDSVKRYLYAKSKKTAESVTDSQPLPHDTRVTLGDSPEKEGDLLDKDDADYRDNLLGSEEEQEEGEGEVTEGQQCDPFSSHLDYLLSEHDVAALQEQPQNECETVQIPELGLVSQQKWICSKPVTTGKGEEQLRMKQRLVSLWPLVNRTTQEKPYTVMQSRLLQYLLAYQDVLYTRRSFENGEEIRRLYVLHALNHVLKTRSRVLKSNAKIMQAHKDGKESGEFPDQGFTRPKVLILLPFREAAYRTVTTLMSLLLAEGEGQVTHRRRFVQEYTDQEKYLEPKKPKPASHTAMFEGNIDDCFKIGIGVSRKVVKLYCDFYSSDIIVASPLGLRTVVGAEGDKARDCDFLSSLEVVIVDQADVYLMQNWEHVTHLFKHFHLQPRQSHGVDISRLRPWVPNGWSKYYCQTLVLSSFPTPEIVSLFLKHCHNYEGRVTIHAPLCDGSIRQVATPIPQVFQRIECGSQLEEFDQRFQYFVEKIIPEFSTPLMQGTAIFIQSYFDFVRIRNYLKKEEISFCQICEYTRTPDVKRARVRFYHKQRHFLIFTERFHFFHRHQLKGIRHVVFYQLPTYAEFFSEILNAVESSDSLEQSAPSCRVLYSRYDEQKLSRTVGSARAQHMLSSGEKVHMFVSGK